MHALTDSDGQFSLGCKLVPTAAQQNVEECVVELLGKVVDSPLSNAEKLKRFMEKEEKQNKQRQLQQQQQQQQQLDEAAAKEATMQQQLESLLKHGASSLIHSHSSFTPEVIASVAAAENNHFSIHNNGVS